MKDYNELIEKRIADGREYRNMELRASGNAGDEMIVEGYATTFNEPYLLWQEDGYRVFEQVDRDAFTGCDMSDVIMQYNHEGRVFARMSNGTLSCTPDDHGLLTRAALGGTEIGRQLYDEIKGGYTDQMSFGFTVAEDTREISENADTKEVEILHMLTSNVGQVFSREQILSRVWGYDYFGDTRTVDAHIKRIRQKLPQEGVPWALKTVYGVGYRFEVNA